MSLHFQNDEQIADINSALKVVGIISLIIFVAEFAMHGLLHQLSVHEDVIDFVQAFALTVMCGPLVYAFVLKPYVKRIKSTEKKLAEAFSSARTQSEQLRAVVERFDVHRRLLDEHALVIETDTSGTIVYVNEAVCKATGYTRNELVGKSQSMLDSGVHDETIWIEMQSVVDRGGTWRRELCDKRKDGSLLWLSTTVAATHDKLGKPSGYLTIATDLSADERRLAAERLRTQQEIIGNIMRDHDFRHAPLQDAIAIINQLATSYGMIDVSYVYQVSENGKDLLPLHAHDRRKGTSFAIEPVPVAYFAPDGNLDSMTERAVFSDLQTDPRITAGRLEYTLKRDMRAAIDHPIAIDGRVVGVYCIRACGAAHQWTEEEQLLATCLANLASVAFERSERQRAEDELRLANVAAIEATKAKSQFLANMSHEIRTPMNGVFGMTDLLSRTELDDRQRKLVATVQDSAKSLLKIINDILDLSRIEAGRIELDVQDFNLRNTLEKTGEMFAHQAFGKGVSMSVFMADDAPSYVSGDPGRLSQIFTNLIGNALKFTKFGEVSLRVTKLGGDHKSSKLKFEVKDTGIGIDQATSEKLFQPFTQAETSISRRFGGTGLGLSITRHLVDLMGGTVSLKSELGSGTTVTVILDMPHAETLAGDGVINYAALQDARLLVIDDSETNRDIISTYLSGCQAEVTLAASTADAWQKLLAAAQSNKPYHAAIVDMLMPGESGVDFAKRVRAHPQLARLKIILATSLNWDGDLAAVREAGIEAVFTKPIRRHALIDEISRVVATVRHQGWKPRGGIITERPKAKIERQATKRFNAHVLLAEDNPVNIEVASAYLQNLGCKVTVAENGVEALRLASANYDTYDIILMDCQMPEMDGLEATRRIRSEASTRSLRHMPIVAVTANAFNDDRVQCIEAGMDDHLGKPFSEAQLERIFAKWAAHTATTSETSSKASAPADSGKSAKTKSAPGKKKARPAKADAPLPEAALDMGMLDQMKSSHPVLFQRMIETFLNYAPEMMKQLRVACQSKNNNALRMAAHSLKSSSANVGATAVSTICRTLEHAIKENPEGDPNTYAELAGKIDTAMPAVLKALKQLIAAKEPAKTKKAAR